jgi:S1-C subfamily serine protease
MTRLARLSFAFVICSCQYCHAWAQQFADPEFDARVDRPAYTSSHPLVLIDEAHNNFHTADGRYKPFADVLKNDGYSVEPSKEKLTIDRLKGCVVLVVANAQGAPVMRRPEAANPAFEEAECDAVEQWVRGGGSLLLITDHHPWGAANERLAKRLGVEMGKSTTFDPTNSENGASGQLIYSRENGLIGDHPIMRGRDGSERIDRAQTFVGQSLKGPKNAVALLLLSKTAVDLPRPAVPGRQGSAAGRAQGLALELGRGKVVVLGEAGMLSAQINGPFKMRVGMNVQGIDNRQLALNIMHWLSGVKFPAPSAVASSNPQPTPAPAGSGAGSLAAATPSGPAPEPVKPYSMPATPSSTSGAEPGRPLTPAEIAAESEPSIAMITGDGPVGTGFLVLPGLIATNAHVIDGEFASSLRVRFPSAEKAQQGPFPAELLYDDTRRDIAFLRVKTALPPLRIAKSYTFRKGEDVTVIGNPGIGGELILENAISRGVMSTRTSLEGQRYYQLGIAVNPGNSGGPVFNSVGAVIGMVTRKSSQQEALAFCIPVDDLNLAIEKVVSFPGDAIEREQSRHRLTLVVKHLGGWGAMYGVLIGLKRKGNGEDAISRFLISGDALDGRVLDSQRASKLKTDMARIGSDPHVSSSLREKIRQLAENLEKLKTLYAADKKSNPRNSDPLPGLKLTHRKLLLDVCKAIDLEVPSQILAALSPSSEESGKKEPSIKPK